DTTLCSRTKQGTTLLPTRRSSDLNDSDVDGNPLTTVLVSGTANGSLTLNADGSFSYTPNANFNGTDSFTYRANDGTINSNVANISEAHTSEHQSRVDLVCRHTPNK